jgi:hypothetical protein
VTGLRPVPAIVALLLLMAPHVRAEPSPGAVAVRVGDHPGYGRIVFDLLPGMKPDIVQDDERVTVSLAGATFALAGAHPPRNVSAVVTGDHRTELTLAPGATLRRAWLGRRLVLDVLDPGAPAAASMVTSPQTRLRPAAKMARPALRPAMAPPGPAAPAAQPPEVPPSPLPPPPDAVQPSAPAPQTAAPPEQKQAAARAPTGGAGPVALAAALAQPPAGMAGRSVLLPFSPSAGAAAFREGESVTLVFDERLPVDMAPLRADPVFGLAVVQVLPEATALRLDVPPRTGMRLTRAAGGWLVTATNDSPPLRPVRPTIEAGRVKLPAEAPGRVVSIPDPATGGLLLVGTLRQAGQAVPVARRTPAFALLPTLLGVVVEPVADTMALRAMPDGFLLDGGQRALALAVLTDDAAVAPDTGQLSRRFDFPSLSMEGLLRRMEAAVARAGATPPQGRASPRKAAAQAMLALGLGPEAQALLQLTVTEDARSADDPEIRGLSAIAALLSGRADEADGIEDARLTGSDEVALWRAVRAAEREEGSVAAAAVFATVIPLILAYPEPLRDRLLPLAAETMALGGEGDMARRLAIARPRDSALDLARALSTTDPLDALALLDRLGQSSDRLVRVRSASRAVELRREAVSLDAAQAADALDKLVYAWRGDRRELDLRLRVAELHVIAGMPRPALSLLRDTDAAFPDRHETIRARMSQIFTEAFTRDRETPMAPLALVELADENADLVPANAAGQALAARLASRLLALDLPRRAESVLKKLMAAVEPGLARAEVGAQLAALRLREEDPAGALRALAASATEKMPPALLEARTLTFAQAAAATGELPRALETLDALDTAAADETRAAMLEHAAQWKEAEATLRHLASRRVPEDGPLNEVQARTLLRLASAAAQAGDELTLADLNRHDAARMPAGPLAQLLGVLTQRPVGLPGDLPRSANESGAARSVPEEARAVTRPALLAGATP